MTTITDRAAEAADALYNMVTQQPDFLHAVGEVIVGRADGVLVRDVDGEIRFEPVNTQAVP